MVKRSKNGTQKQRRRTTTQSRAILRTRAPGLVLPQSIAPYRIGSSRLSKRQRGAIEAREQYLRAALNSIQRREAAREAKAAIRRARAAARAAAPAAPAAEEVLAIDVAPAEDDPLFVSLAADLSRLLQIGPIQAQEVAATALGAADDEVDALIDRFGGLMAANGLSQSQGGGRRSRRHRKARKSHKKSRRHH